MTTAKTSYRTCPLCEATCGLAITTRDREVVEIRGDEDDVLSHGFICPKAYALKDLDTDPDRVRTPLLREGETWKAVSWDEAFAAIDAGLGKVIAEHGRSAVAAYAGNPTAHNLSSMTYLQALLRGLGSPNTFSASTVDQMPKHVSAGLMFGSMMTIPVPDIDRTDCLVIMGADPLESNGSLLTAPDMKGRIRRLRDRGGRVIVIDPRRSRTASVADEHHFIRPGTDAHLLLGIVQTLFAESLIAPAAVADHLAGLDTLEETVRPFSPERVAPACGIAPEAIRHLARQLAGATRAAVYARIGTCTQEFGTLASWLVDVVNTLTGNLDREGGAMFTKAAAGAGNTKGAPGKGRGIRLGQRSSRVRGADAVFGELPVACMAEEMETPGEGQVRALITVAGNPVVSTPNAGRLRNALAGLDFMVSVDIYVNETTRHANVILPAPSHLERSHYDLALYQLAIRNVAHYSAPIFPRPADSPDEWEILLRLTGVVTGQGPNADLAALDDFIVGQLVQREVAGAGSIVEGRDPNELIAALAPRRGPERLLDFMLRTGPYGEGFGAHPDGVSLDKLEAHPHGIDFGALAPRIPEVLRTPSGKIELAPDPLLQDVARLEESLAREVSDETGAMTLIGRRQLRSNNSWMHNLEVLVKGKVRCTLLVHPDDASSLGLVEGQWARVASRVGQVVVPVEITDAIMRGVVSIPHGWGHDDAGVQLQVATAHAGANSNVLTDEQAIDPLSGNAILNGIPVRVEAAPGA